MSPDLAADRGCHERRQGERCELSRREWPAPVAAGRPRRCISAFDRPRFSAILSNQTRTLEDIVKDMMRPMLKPWLDDNLPVLVEHLVREEIERVSRGRR